MMDCTICGEETIVKDSRAANAVKSRQHLGGVIRRRRECQHCDRRFTTYEISCDDGNFANLLVAPSKKEWEALNTLINFMDKLGADK